MKSRIAFLAATAGLLLAACDSSTSSSNNGNGNPSATNGSVRAGVDTAVNIPAGQTLRFQFTPKANATYTIKTLGNTDTHLELRDFDGGMEWRAPGRDKGVVVKTILAQLGKDTAAAYLGDDQTDEDAFHALKGNGLTALVRSQSRPTAADIWLQPPHQLLQFLQEWLRASGG